MADQGIRALAPIIATPGTSLSAISGLTVPANKEWTLRFMRATNVSGSDATITVAINGAGGEIAYNEVVPAASSSRNGAKNILGPDFITLPPGASVSARASAASAVRLVTSVTERDL